MTSRPRLQKVRHRNIGFFSYPEWHMSGDLMSTKWDKLGGSWSATKREKYRIRNPKNIPTSGPTRHKFNFRRVATTQNLHPLGDPLKTLGGHNKTKALSWHLFKRHFQAGLRIFVDRRLRHWNPHVFRPLRPHTPSGKLTWNLKMEGWKMIFCYKGMISNFHVGFQGCRWKETNKQNPKL